MYKKFYGLNRNPFELSPDPYFLFPTAKHNEALASILYGVMRRKGFMVVSGEVGTGKTLLVRCLLEMMRRQEVASANVFNPCLSPIEFLRYVGTDFGLRVTNLDKGALLMELNRFLITRYQKGLTAVLVVDEAQHLEAELLEEIRLLTNLETSQQKLLQIVLVGQPELDRKMDSANLRQLKQRVALRCQLLPLQEAETQGYILRRLDRAGANSRATKLFPTETVAAVHHYSRGIPRLINTLCENALIAGYAQKSPAITCAMIHEIASDLRLNVLTPVADTNGIPSGQQALAKTLLELMQVLERATKRTKVAYDSAQEKPETIII
ncbi:MAG TPA: AAA family ATPase [Terriglobales bacterium]|nr:AAA family ATPase [Terriglobales bacterium]